MHLRLIFEGAFFYDLSTAHCGVTALAKDFDDRKCKKGFPDMGSLVRC